MAQSTERIDYDLFIKNFTPESVYILGLLWADGHVRKNTNGIGIECMSTDMEYFCTVFNKTGNYNITHRHRENRQPQTIINFFSLILSNFLKENDYTLKSKGSPTKILEKIPHELQFYFFLGWTDGDGCFYHSKNMEITQFCMCGAYEQDWTALSNLCYELKITYYISNFVTVKNHRYSRFLISKNDIRKFGNYIYQNNNFGLSRKRLKYEIIKTHISKNTFEVFCYDLNDNFINKFDNFLSASQWINPLKDSRRRIREACQGKWRTSCGYQWKMKNILMTDNIVSS